MPQSPFASGFKTIDGEVESTELTVEGKLPEWMSGELLRTAPARFEIGKASFNHWFDGLAMLHKFSFENGNVKYANRYLQSQNYREDIKAGTIARPEFATDPCRSIFGRAFSFFTAGKTSDNANVSISVLDEKAVSVTETPMPILFDPDTLETHGRFKYSDALQGQTTVAHPHFDRRGTLFSYLLHFGAKSRYQLYRMNRGSRSRHVFAEVPSREPSYMHSFGMSERYVILARPPLVVQPLNLQFGNKPFIENFRWKPDRGTVFDIVEKDGGRLVKSVATDAFFTFHHVNAFEADGAVVVDLVAYPDARIIEDLYLSNLRDSSETHATAELRRYRIPLGSGGIEQERLSEQTIELPRINYPDANARPYRYVYANAAQEEGNFLDSIVKIDISSGVSKLWNEPGCYPGEPVFVRLPHGHAEDHGVVLSVVLDTARDKSFLLALRASDFSEIARAEAPLRIPFGFHGQYFPGRGVDLMSEIHR